MAPTPSAAEGGDGQHSLDGDGATVAWQRRRLTAIAFGRRHRRKTPRLTGMELVTYCAQEDSLHMAAAMYVRVGKGRKIELIPVSLAVCCEADISIAIIVAIFL